VNGSYDFTDDLQFVGSASYTNRFATRQIAGYPFQAAPFGTPMSVDSIFNPLGNQAGFSDPQEIGNWWRRGWEVPRVTDSDVDTVRFTAGLNGAFEFGDRSFSWDASYL